MTAGVGQLIQNTDYKRILVTATPIFNSYKDCYVYLKILEVKPI